MRPEKLGFLMLARFLGGAAVNQNRRGLHGRICTLPNRNHFGPEEWTRALIELVMHSLTRIRLAIVLASVSVMLTHLACPQNAAPADRTPSTQQPGRVT